MSPLADRIPILRVLAHLHAGHLAALSPSDRVEAEALAALKAQGLRLPKATESTKRAAQSGPQSLPSDGQTQLCASNHPGQDDAPRRLAALARAADLADSETLPAFPIDHLANVLLLLAQLESRHPDLALLLRQHHLAWIQVALKEQSAHTDFSQSLAAVTATEISHWLAVPRKIERHKAPPPRRKKEAKDPLALRESQQ